MSGTSYSKNYPQTCKQCKKKFKGMYNQLYCSQKCYLNFVSIKREFKEINRGTVGAIQELRVSVDLLAKGFEVYRALSPASSSDLLILKKGKAITVEVRTAYRNGNGVVNAPMKNMKSTILAKVLPQGEIIYEPKLEG